MQVSTGATDYMTAVRQASKNLADKGIRYIDYESGVHTSLEAAVRRNVMGGLGLMQEQISKRTHDEMEADGWEISAHAASAPDHEPIQGRQYSDKEYEALNNSLVRRIGTLNCGHAAFPIIMGVSIPQYSDEELEKFRADNEKGITYNGKHYTAYEATQRQRNLEANIRKQRRKILIDEATGDDKKLQTDQIKLQLLNQEYSRFSNAAGLRKQHDRMETVGYNWKQERATEKAWIGRTATFGEHQAEPRQTDKDVLESFGNSGTIISGDVLRQDIADILGVDVRNIQIDSLPVEAQKIIRDSISETIDKFPQLKGYTRKIVYDPDLKAVAASRSLTGELLISSDFMDVEKLKKTYNYDVRLGLHPKGTDYRSILTHELGHQLDGLLTIKGVYGGSVSQYGTVRTSAEVQKEVLNRLGLTYERMREIRKEYAEMGYSGEKLNHAVRFERREFIQKHISDYANENEREFFAECFSEYMTSSEPREAATIFGEVLEMILGELK